MMFWIIITFSWIIPFVNSIDCSVFSGTLIETCEANGCVIEWVREIATCTDPPTPPTSTSQDKSCYCTNPDIMAFPNPDPDAFGYGDCDCKGGVVELRFKYTGIEPVDITLSKGTDIVCSYTDIQENQEIVCDITATTNPNGPWDKFATDTLFVITHPDGTLCEGKFHTSCSQDIVGQGPTSGVCDEIICSGWRDREDPSLNCDDGYDPCDCALTPPPTDPPTPIPTTNETSCYCDTTNGAVNPNTGGAGWGDCDCSGGMIELRWFYEGIDVVDIQVFESNDVVCDFTAVQPNDEVICNILDSVHNVGQWDKFQKDTVFAITHPNGDICTDSFHTSCSRDIVGYYGSGGTCNELKCSGWKDGDTTNVDCDDGFGLCDCALTPPPTYPPTPVPTTNETVCYCDTTNGVVNPNTGGAGWGDCDCSGGMIELRWFYKGIDVVDIQVFESNDVVCDFTAVQPNAEVICNILDPINLGQWDKFQKDTVFEITHPNGDICTDRFHTSCSRDIVGYYGSDGTCDELICSGWKDADTTNVDCDDGIGLCDCPTVVNPTDPPTPISTPQDIEPTSATDCGNQILENCYAGVIDGCCYVEEACVACDSPLLCDEDDSYLREDCPDPDGIGCSLLFDGVINTCILNRKFTRKHIYGFLKKSTKKIIDEIVQQKYKDFCGTEKLRIELYEVDTVGDTTLKPSKTDECEDLDTVCGPDKSDPQNSITFSLGLFCGDCATLKELFIALLSEIDSGEFDAEFVAEVLKASEDEDTVCLKGFGGVEIEKASIAYRDEDFDVVSEVTVITASEAQQRYYYVGLVVIGIVFLLH